MNKKTIADIDVKGKQVLLRVDFNVPLDAKTGAITDDSRIKACLPTIKYLLSKQAKVIACSHLGRPKGRDLKLSMEPVAKRFSELVGVPVATTPDCIGPKVEAAAKALTPGGILLLENLRFYPEEEKNDPAFAKALASLASVYVNDAFGAAHRAHASTEGVAKYIPAVAGLLMQKELEFLGKALTNPERPLGALVGGAKITDKTAMLENLLEKVNVLLIGGGMAATFFKAKGYEVGKSLVEADKITLVQELQQKATKKGVRLVLPLDVVVAERFEADSPSRTVPVAQMPGGWFIMDIGPQTIAMFGDNLKRCKTVLWNGPMGVFEFPRFAEGTKAMAGTLAGLKATSIIGGGSTAEAVNALGLADRMSHVSTGGGASLEFLEGKPLPGVVALLDK